MNAAPDQDQVEPERLKIAIEAAWEAEQLCLRMIEMCGLDRLDFRGMAARLLALSRASMWALTDPDHELADIRRRLGCKDFGNTVGMTTDIQSA
ncbi:hypothetical protein [Solimonas soli]|uniref:hypothetical protein n=1 Tax=Solimonas soli TaxID=413479 RepID=UPI0004856258|nr:hypothetical protein [Solimonas soli]